MIDLQHPDCMTDRCRHRLTQRLPRFLLLSVTLLLNLATVLPANAIMIRHDTGYSRFLARESDYPAVFPLHASQQQKTCVATLISPRWALTAAHCAQQTPLMSTLQSAGAYAITVAGQQFIVDQLIFHPDWSPSAGRVFNSAQIDLALLRLSTDVTHIDAVPLYAVDNELGQVMTFLGWGYSGIGRTGIAVNDGRLRFARNRVSSAEQQLYFQFNDPSGPGSVAVEFEGIPGLGDSGGPALITMDGEHWLAGIAIGELEKPANSQLNQASGRYGATVVYERISQHLTWIRAVMAADERVM
jgi:secreted trypsin-like serine protease